jgi:hypothetical protein
LPLGKKSLTPQSHSGLHIKRTHFHKVLKGLTTKGQCNIEWFFGLKLHFIINNKGGTLDFVLISSNINDRHQLLGSNLLQKIYEKINGFIF